MQHAILYCAQCLYSRLLSARVCVRENVGVRVIMLHVTGRIAAQRGFILAETLVQNAPPAEMVPPVEPCISQY